MMVQTWNPQNIIHDIFNHCCLEYYNIHVMKFIQEAHKREKMTFYIWNKRVWIFCCLIIVSLHMVGFFEQVFWSKTLIFCCVTFQKLLWNIARKEMNGVTSYPSHCSYYQNYCYYFKWTRKDYFEYVKRNKLNKNLKIL